MAETSQQQSESFDLGLEQIARVYAKAFLDAANSMGKTDQMQEELDSLVDDVLTANPRFEEMLGSWFLSQEEKNDLIDRTIASQGSPEFVAFLKVLSSHDRLDCLRAIRSEVQKLTYERVGKIEVILKTAEPLSGAVREEILNSLRNLLGKEPVAQEIVAPEMLGGLIVRVGDKVFDGSVLSQLDRMKAEIVERAVEKIETRREAFV